MSVYNGTESAACLGPKISEIIPSEVKKKWTILQDLNKQLTHGNLIPANVDYGKPISRMLVLFKK